MVSHGSLARPLEGARDGAELVPGSGLGAWLSGCGCSLGTAGSGGVTGAGVAASADVLCAGSTVAACSALRTWLLLARAAETSALTPDTTSRKAAPPTTTRRRETEVRPTRAAASGEVASRRASDEPGALMAGSA
jgi:hypothetical protein